LQNKIRTQQQKKNQKERDVHQRNEHKPGEVIINCALEFHESGGFKCLSLNCQRAGCSKLETEDVKPFPL
jgi:hypothetical protein